MSFLTGPWIPRLPFLLCAAWLSFTVAFVGMVTSGGEPGMELEIGPFFSLRDTAAIWFSRGMIGLGAVMALLLWLRRRTGFILAAAWSIWWAVILTTAVFGTSGTERVASIIVIALFCASGWYATTHRAGAGRP